MGRDDRARFRRNGAFERRGIQVERRGIDVREHHAQPGGAGQLGNHPERQRREDDLRSGRQLERDEDVVEGHAPVRGRHRVHRVHAQAPRECGLELRNVRSLDELAAGLAAGDDFFGVGQHSRAVARDRCQHKEFGICNSKFISM
jgi:hypothetical protein